MYDNVYCDVDNVINNFTEQWIEWLSSLYNIDHTFDEMTVYDMTQIYPELTKQELFYPVLQKQFWMTLEPNMEAIEGLRYLCEIGYPIKLVTATHYVNLYWKVEWLKEYCPFIHHEDIWKVSQKQSLVGKCLIDDCLDNHINGNYIGFLWDKPWNQHAELSDKLIRVRSLADVITHLQAIDNKVLVK